MVKMRFRSPVMALRIYHNTLTLGLPLNLIFGSSCRLTLVICSFGTGAIEDVVFLQRSNSHNVLLLKWRDEVLYRVLQGSCDCVQRQLPLQ